MDIFSNITDPSDKAAAYLQFELMTMMLITTILVVFIFFNTVVFKK